MNILIDFTQIPLKKVGVGIYAFNLIKCISQLDNSNKYYILIQNDENCFNSIKKENVNYLNVNSNYFRLFSLRIILEQFYIPFLILKYKIDILHSLHYSFPLISFNAKRIVTIHDLTFFLFPKLHTFFKRYYFRFFTNLAVKFSNEIICVSNSTKKDLMTFTNVNENKISVIHLGRDEFIPNISREQIVSTCYKYNIKSQKKYILFIGTLEPRKNISTILKAFNSFQKEILNYQLVIVGGKGWYYDDLFQLANSLNSQDIVFTGYIDETEKSIFLAGADFFVYPSLYEGFGVPILEALSFSLPTITSNLSSMPEVAGDAALLINPNSEEEMLAAFLKFATDKELRDIIVSKCKPQVEKFSWRKMTQETINIYNSKFYL